MAAYRSVSSEDTAPVFSLGGDTLWKWTESFLAPANIVRDAARSFIKMRDLKKKIRYPDMPGVSWKTENK